MTYAGVLNRYGNYLDLPDYTTPVTLLEGNTPLIPVPRLAKSLGDKKVMIMRNHGFITCGRTAGEAFMLMHYLVRACKVQLQALASGRKIEMPDPKVWQQAAEQYSHFEPGIHEWPALVRLLDKEDPSYRE